MNQDTEHVTYYVGPKGEKYSDEETSRKAWEEYNNMHVHIGPNGKKYAHRNECEEAWKEYNSNPQENNNSQGKGRK